MRQLLFRKALGLASWFWVSTSPTSFESKEEGIRFQVCRNVYCLCPQPAPDCSCNSHCPAQCDQSLQPPGRCTTSGCSAWANASADRCVQPSWARLWSNRPLGHRLHANRANSPSETCHVYFWICSLLKIHWRARPARPGIWSHTRRTTAANKRGDELFSVNAADKLQSSALSYISSNHFVASLKREWRNLWPLIPLNPH